MFSFHKPKIYRSLSGCCICKAKSSSSRFTDSKKYESEFERCFRIVEKRSGEICNACVLLVKRWKKLPLSTTRNWNHVVDARAGPGTKSMKSKLNNNINDNNNNPTIIHNQIHRKHHHNNHKKLLKPKNIKGLNITDKNISLNTRGDDNLNELSEVQNNIQSPDASDSSDIEDEIEEDIEDMEEEIEVQKIDKKTIENSNKSSLDDSSKTSKVSANNKRNNCESDSPTNTANKISSFLDMSFWRKEKICCGIIFKGPDNEVLIYPKLLEPCFCRKNKSDVIKNKLNANLNSGSSDSGSVGSLSLIEDDVNSNASSGNVSPI